MEPSKEPVSMRVARINAEIVGKSNYFEEKCLLSREGLLDALQVLYDECSSDSLQKYDSNIAAFVEKYKTTIKQVKMLRVNIGDFEIKDIIGRGHFGEVHLVKEKQTGYVYAMKTIRKFDNETKKMTFEDERNIMAYSASPWLTSLQYAFQDSSYLFFIMDYHPGGDLLGLLYRQGSTLPESAALFYIAELILALEDLHDMGYVHRDIKPDNILLDRCGHLKLADFGSAAKLDKKGLVKMGPPVGTPDYIAPEVLQSLENKNEKGSGYGVSCDFWSLGVLAYELTIGTTPFRGQNNTMVYSKIMNFANNLKFPPDVVLSQAYVSFVKGLITDAKKRLDRSKIRNHILFKSINFDTLRDQVPPYVPKISSVEDTSNFSDVQVKKKYPSMENFKKKTQFSGRNLPFIGFTFTLDPHFGSFSPNFSQKSPQNDEAVQDLKSELESLRLKLSKTDDFNKEKDCLERKVEEKGRKLESLECLRDKLEKDLAGSIAECTALKRTLDLERKERSELEKKALDLIKSAKLKWELSEKAKTEELTLEIEQLKAKICQLSNTNQTLDEQLQKALSTENKHRESIEHVQNLSRRSVIGLESRLEKVTVEAESQITDIKLKLDQEKHHSMLLQNKLLATKEKELALKDKLKIAEDNYENLKSKVYEAESVIQELSNKVKTLEEDMDSDIQNYKKEIRTLQCLFDDSQKTIKDMQNQNTILQKESENMEGYKNEIEKLKEQVLKMQSDRTISNLERELDQEKERCRSLQKRLEEAVNVVSDNQELREMRTRYWRMEKELGNCKIDKRIVERELKEAQAETKELTSKIAEHDRKLAETKKAQESALMELAGINESLSMELLKMKENHKTLQEQLNSEKDKSTAERTLTNELNAIINGKEQKIQSLNRELEKLNQGMSCLEKRCQNEEEERTKLMRFVEDLQKEKGQIHSELEKCQREQDNTNLNLGALREACTLLESQVIEYEKINIAHQLRERDLQANTEKLISDLCEARQETQEARRNINEQKSLKAMAEAKIKRLEEDVTCLENESKSYKQQCMEYKQYSNNLADELTVAEEKVSNLQVELKSYERQIESFTCENRVLKEEIAELITQLSKHKDSNFKLKRQVGDLKESSAGLVQKLRELERIMTEKSHYYNERELKSEATVKQQIKLIDYLQTKIDEQSHKKKTLTQVIFGSSHKKENQPPISMAMNYKDMEEQLTKERQNNRQLKEEIYKLKASTLLEVNSNVLDKISKVERHKSEILSPKSRDALQNIVNSPNSQKNDLYRQNSLQRMHHNIPHRFESKLCTKSLKCVQCNDATTIGTKLSICKECGVMVHQVCASAVPRTCGLPKAFANHYKESLRKIEDEEKSSSMEEKRLVEEANIEGWVKVPCTKTNTWQKRYMRLTKSSIDVYAQNPQDSGAKLLASFPLNPETCHGKVMLEPSASEIGVPVANSDLPFIMQVEVAPDNTCWPSQSLMVMALSAKEKDAWFTALQKTFNNGVDISKFDTVAKVPELDINKVLDITENIIVIGAEDGLYSYYENNLLKIDGLSRVTEITTIPAANLVIMIAESDSTLILCDLNHLINLTQCSKVTKPTLKYRNGFGANQNFSGFHILQVSKYSDSKICAATDKQVMILQYCFKTNACVPLRILDTAQPASCLLFTENSLIVGADKFFEIDLNSFQAEEFLDVSDVRLRLAVKCSKIGSFPISIVEVSKNPKEFLLSFNEFSIFVDEYGRCSREKELKFPHLPLALHLSKQCLYVVQFAAIEILKINPETCNTSDDNLERSRLELSKFKHVGSNSKGVYILQDDEIRLISANKLDLDVSSTISETTENCSESDRFSFTSSMVQSLDGNLTDSDCLEDVKKGRRVKFDQTDF